MIKYLVFIKLCVHVVIMLSNRSNCSNHGGSLEERGGVIERFTVLVKVNSVFCFLVDESHRKAIFLKLQVL